MENGLLNFRAHRMLFKSKTKVKVGVLYKLVFLHHILFRKMTNFFFLVKFCSEIFKYFFFMFEQVWLSSMSTEFLNADRLSIILEAIKSLKQFSN